MYLCMSRSTLFCCCCVYDKYTVGCRLCVTIGNEFLSDIEYMHMHFLIYETYIKTNLLENK